MSRRLLIKNLSGVVNGRLGSPLQEHGSILVEDKMIMAFDSTEPSLDGQHDVMIDAAGAVAVPGLIDSHVHTTFGDWTPRQNTVGWIDSYMHGGTTMMMSASEVHVPNRPRDREGLVALALAAQRSWSGNRPGGVKVLGGSVILDSELQDQDFEFLAAQGVYLAKLGFGAHPDVEDMVRVVKSAQSHGFIVMNHTGGCSIPGSWAIDAETAVALGADIIGHANGGPTSLPDDDLLMLFDAPGHLQLVQAGNLRSALVIIRLAQEHDALHRVLIATDTPTGTGVIPLGMIKSIVEVSSLSGLRATDALALATSNPAHVLRRREGVLEVGAPADIVLMQAPAGGSAQDPLTAIERGDIPGIAGVVIDGTVTAGRSRNTPAPSRELTVT